MRDERLFWSPEKVFDFKPKAEEPTGKRHWFLWPVRLWQALLYEEAESHLNPLQEVILRLCLAGTREEKKIAHLLSLGEESDIEGLVAYLKEELTGMGCLGELSEVTDRGKRLLDGGERVLGRSRVGWFFQDLWTEELVPLVVDPQSIARADIQIGQNGKPILTTGSKGAPRIEVPWVINPSQKQTHPTQKPSPGDLLMAAEEDEKRRRAAEGFSEGGRRRTGQAKLDKENPQIIHVLGFVYISKESGGWEISDPFQTRRDIQFRKQLCDLKKTETSIGSFFEKIFSEEPSEQQKQWEQEEQHLIEQAQQAVREKFPESTAVDDREVRKCLEAAWEAWFRWEKAKSTSNPERWAAAIWLGWRQAIEKSVDLLIKEWPCGQSWKKLYHGPQERIRPKDQVSAILKATIKTLGFLPRTDGGKERYPFEKLSADQIRFASQQNNSYRIGPRIGACLLSAPEKQQHPLHNIAKKAPSWLVDLEELLRGAGGAIHATKPNTHDETQLYDAQKQLVSLVNRLFDELGSSNDE